MVRTFSIEDLLLRGICIIDCIELEGVLLVLMFRVRNSHERITIPQCSQRSTVLGVLLLSFVVEACPNNDIQFSFRLQVWSDSCNDSDAHIVVCPRRPILVFLKREFRVSFVDVYG